MRCAGVERHMKLCFGVGVSQQEAAKEDASGMA